MNALSVAACLLILVGIAHSYLGERYILIRLFRRHDLPELFGGTQFTTRTLRFAWHLTTLAWWGFAAVLALLAKTEPTRQSICWVTGITFVLSGFLILTVSHGRHLAWPLLLAVGTVCIACAHGWL